MSNITILIYYGFLIVILYLIVHVLIVTNCCNVTKRNTVSDTSRRVQHRVIRCIRIDPSNSFNNIVRIIETGTDAQSNVFTIHNPSNYHDIYCVASNTSHLQAAAISQVEKDEKDLPTYEEVMRLSLAATATQYTSDLTPTEMGTGTYNMETTTAVSETMSNLNSSSDIFISLPSIEPAPPYDEVILNTNAREMMNDNLPSCSRSITRTVSSTIPKMSTTVANSMNSNNSITVTTSTLTTTISTTSATTTTSTLETSSTAAEVGTGTGAATTATAATVAAAVAAVAAPTTGTYCV